MVAKCSTALLSLTLAACTYPSPEAELLPLADDRHAADVLTESRAIALPPSFGGNRFLRGWFPWRHQGAQVFVPEAGGALIEIVNLSDRRRTLSVTTRRLGQPGEFEVGIEVAGRRLESVPLAPIVEIDLPSSLPRGRVPVTLTFPKQPDPVVLEAGLGDALPPGEVEIAPDRIVQAPHSLIDFVRPVQPGTLLSGSFEPPTEARPGQRFALLVERASRSPVTVFEWRSSWLDRLRGTRSFSLPLVDQADFVRFRLSAEGSGPAGVWRDLGLHAPAAAETVATDLPPRPRLVILYVLDALRADHLDLDDRAASRTPTLRRLGAEGVVFERHLSVAPNTIPSTKSLFTGRAYVSRGHGKLAPDGPETLAEVYSRAGYRTAAFSGNGYISEAYGTARGFEHLADEVVFQDYRDAPGSYNDNAERVQRAALEWLDALAGDDRAFLYLHTIHPHNPYDPPEPFHSRFTADVDSTVRATTRNLLDIKHHRLAVSEADQQRIRALYEGAVAYNDAQIALLVEALEQRFAPQDILLIVTSDHGEELFDHDGVLHGYTLYREQLHIPLILWWPGRLEPRRVRTATDNLDLHESLRALVGAPASADADGRPFWNLARGGDFPSDAPELRFAAASSVRGGIFAAQSERYKLILAPRVGLGFGMGEGRGRGRDPEYLFDLAEDPGERINLAGHPGLEAAWLRSRLQAWVEHGKRQETGEEEPELDDETEARLRALGYLE